MVGQEALINMVKQQLRTGDVLDESILTLFNQIPRHDFVPEAYKAFAYSDMQIPLMHHQRMLTPLEEGKILQALALTGNETVLEIGTGTGFFTALLSRLCKKVISVDYYSDFTHAAKSQLAIHQCTNVELYTGDGHAGWFEKAPYDVMIFTGAMEKLERSHTIQLLPGGKIIAIIGNAPIMQAQLHHQFEENEWTISVLFETDIPPLIDRLKPKKFVF